MKTDFRIQSPKPVLLSSFTATRRAAIRPMALRDADFDEQFDDDVLFYDAFYRHDGKIALVGPSLNNLKPAMQAMALRDRAGGTAYPFRIVEMDRHAQIIVDAAPGLASLHLDCAFGSVTMEIQPSDVEAFAGRRAIMTISKNNKLSWIRDWLHFACRVHGADALILFDNGSTQYPLTELLAAISDVEGLKTVRIVPWLFKFGPQGTLTRGTWDSDYCQLGAWEHARWKYLTKARSVQNSDIDELVVSTRGRSNFVAVENDPFGMLRYTGRWIVGTNSTAISSTDPGRRHVDYDTVLKTKRAFKFGIWPYDTTACFPKWTVVPMKCPPRAQWKMHAIAGWLPALRISKEFSFRHFREISDSWKYLRSDRPDFDPAVHERDTLMQDYFSKLRAAESAR
jgi:hypothetical protein